MKKSLALLLAGVLACGLTACGTPAETPSEDPAEGEATGTYTVGICQLVQHEALDAATQGFKDALTEKLGEDGVKFEEGNASGESANCATIVNGFLSSDVDLILANATAPLQAAAAATDSIPVLGTSVTDYATALDLAEWTGTVGTNVSGTSDLAPLDQQAAMIQELFPEAKTIGLLYCSGEPNSSYQCDVMEGYLKDMNYTVERFAFTDTNDVNAVTQSACDASDVIYLPRRPPRGPTQPPPTPKPSPTWSWLRRSPWWPARKASARAAAWLPCPSATTIWARSPARWPMRSWSTEPTPPPWK